MKNYKKITVTLIDGENTLEKLLTAIKDIGNTGHSFDILVDPKPDYDTNPNHGEGENFYWDGDGSDSIRHIKIEEISEDEFRSDLKEDISPIKYLFHATPSSNYQSIKKNGLKLGFDGRIYLATSFGAAADIAQQLAKEYNNNENFYSVFKVNVTGLKLTVDEDYNAGFFVTTPIPPSKIRHYESVKIIKEIIELPVEVGDTILTGRFKNHKVEVKDIGEDEHGMPTVNGKQITKIRIPKLEEAAYLKRKDIKMKEQDSIKKVLILLEAQVDKDEAKKKEPLKEGVLDQLAQLWVSNAHTVTPDMPDGLVFKLAVGLVLGITAMTITHYKWNDILAFFKKSPDKAQEVVNAAKAVQSSNSVAEVKSKLNQQGV